MNKLQQALDRALQALEKLEQALKENDNRKIGAALFELRHELKEAEHEAHKTNRR